MDKTFRNSLEKYIVTEIQPDIGLSQAKFKLSELVKKNSEAVLDYISYKRDLSGIERQLSTKRRHYTIQVTSENNSRTYKERWNKEVAEAKIANLVENDPDLSGLVDKERRFKGMASTLEEIIKHNRLVGNVIKEIIIALTSASKDRRNSYE